MIIASGFAQVDGSVVVTPDDLNFTAPLIYTIISTGTGVTGTFSSLTSTVPALMNLTYNPLTVQLTYLPINSTSLTGNALKAANAFATVPALPGSDAAAVNPQTIKAPKLFILLFIFRVLKYKMKVYSLTKLRKTHGLYWQ